ncbi:MAG: hypothetical protein GX868_10135 [Actinobacteria bacterium]|nr:hypothetical protein [Actinomycetota bacterium]
MENSDNEPTDVALPGHVVVGATRINDWFRLLRAILVVVVPLAVAGALITATPAAGRSPSGDDFAFIVVNLVVHTSFWVSLVYAYVDWRERTGEIRVHERPSLSVVDGDTVVHRMLPPNRRVSLGEVVGPIAIWISITAFVFGQRRIAPLTDAGLIVPVLDPDSWPWRISLVGWMAANSMSSLVATFRMGRWTPATTITSIVASLIVAGTVARDVASGTWINPDYLKIMELTDAARDRFETRLVAATLAVVIAVTVWTIAIAVRGWRRDRTAPPLHYG